MKKFKLKSGDTVRVIAGDHKGSEGKVLQIVKDKDRVVVEGVNMISKHTKPTSANPQGGIIKQESKINISNLMLIDPKSGEPTKVGRRKDKETKKIIRFSKKSGEEIK